MNGSLLHMTKIYTKNQVSYLLEIHFLHYAWEYDKDTHYILYYLSLFRGISQCNQKRKIKGIKIGEKRGKAILSDDRREYFWKFQEHQC